MTEDEIKKHELEHTACIKDLIDYLKNNFKDSDYVCYMDCIEGYKNDCTYITEDQLGDRFFKYVGKSNGDFPYVDENDVIVI